MLFVLLWCPCALHVSFHFFALWPSFVLSPHASFAKYLFSCYPFLLPLLEHVSSSPPSTPPSTPPSNRRLCFRHLFLPSSSFLLSCRRSIDVSFAPFLFFHRRSLGLVLFLLPPSNHPSNRDHGPLPSISMRPTCVLSLAVESIEIMVFFHRDHRGPPVFFLGFLCGEGGGGGARIPFRRDRDSCRRPSAIETRSTRVEGRT